MPTFRFSGDVRYAFVHEIEAETLALAQAKVEDTPPGDLDDVCTNSGGTMIEVHSSCELDEDGEEIE